MHPDSAISFLGKIPKLENEFSFGQNSPITLIGTPEQIRENIDKKIGKLEISEIMFQDLISDHESRLNCYKLLSKEFRC